MLLPPKFCPSCRDEFVHSATVCGECEVPLVLKENLSDLADSDFPPEAELVCVRVADSGWALGLAELLKENQVPHRVGMSDPEAAKQVYGVFVLPDDVEIARELDAVHARREMPDLPEGFDPREMMTGPAAEGDSLEDVCPACGDALESNAQECTGCGLALLVAE
jgi:hypothetical protein